MSEVEQLEVSVSELAAIKRVSAQAISKKLQRYVRAGLITTRRKGKSVLIPLARWDEVADEVTDPARITGRDTMRAAQARPDAPAPTTGDGDPEYQRERARRERFSADKAEIEMRKLRGELVEAREVEAAMTRCAEAIVRALEQMPSWADDLAGAMTRGGETEMRKLLKAKGRGLRETLARSMSMIAADDDETPETGETSEAA